MTKVTWDELARIYTEHVKGGRARTKPMEIVYNWALTRPDLFWVDEQDEGQLYHKEKK